MQDDRKDKKNNEKKIQTSYYEIIEENEDKTDPLKPKVTIYRNGEKQKKFFKKAIKDSVLTY